MSYGKEISIWFLAIKYIRHGSIKGHGNRPVKIRPVKIRPVIFGLLLYANEVWRRIFQILQNTTGHWYIRDFLPGVTAFQR